MTVASSPFDRLTQDLPELLELRRHLHAHPELSGEEHQTAALVAGELRQLGWSVREAVGPDVAVLVDVHSRFTLRGARQLLEEVAPLKLHWLEDTVRGLVRTPPQTGAALDHNRR